MTIMDPSETEIQSLVDLVFAAQTGRYEGLTRWVEAQCGIVESTGWGCIARTGRGTVHGFNVGDDPITVLVSFLFAVFGQNWGRIPITGEAIAAVNAEWGRRSKGTKVARPMGPDQGALF